MVSNLSDFAINLKNPLLLYAETTATKKATINLKKNLDNNNLQ
jgi:hypothetical protein